MRKMIPTSFHERTNVDVKTNFDAVLKRTHMFIFVHVPLAGEFFRMASADEDDVPFHA